MNARTCVPRLTPATRHRCRGSPLPHPRRAPPLPRAVQVPYLGKSSTPHLQVAPLIAISGLPRTPPEGDKFEPCMGPGNPHTRRVRPLPAVVRPPVRPCPRMRHTKCCVTQSLHDARAPTHPHNTRLRARARAPRRSWTRCSASSARPAGPRWTAWWPAARGAATCGASRQSGARGGVLGRARLLRCRLTPALAGRHGPLLSAAAAMRVCDCARPSDRLCACARARTQHTPAARRPAGRPTSCAALAARARWSSTCCSACWSLTPRGARARRRPWRTSGCGPGGGAAWLAAVCSVHCARGARGGRAKGRWTRVPAPVLHGVQRSPVHLPVLPQVLCAPADGKQGKRGLGLAGAARRYASCLPACSCS